MRARFPFIIAVCALFLIPQSCDRITMVKEYIAFSESVVRIPDEMRVFQNGIEVGSESINFTKPLLVRFYGSEECTECAISHMSENLCFSELARSNNLEFLVILSPKIEEKRTIEDNIRGMVLPIKVCLDESLIIESQEVIPKTTMFHLFLLDNNGHPVYIGNPLVSEKRQTEFKEVVNSLNI